MKLQFENEHALWIALGREDTQALQYMYKKYFHIWISWMSQRGGNVNDGEDIFQDALLIIVQKAKDTQFQLTAQVNTFLLTICKRMWYKKLERTQTTYEIQDDVDFNSDDSIDIIEEQRQKEEQYHVMNEALIQLGEPCASLLRSFYIDNKSMSDIAEQFNYTNSDNAKTQKYKCLNRLKKLFFSAQESQL